MINFIAVAGRPDDVQSALPDLSAAITRSRVLKGQVRTIVAPGGAWAIAALENQDLLTKNRFACDGDDVLVINGAATIAAGAGAQADLPQALLSRFRQSGSSGVVDAVGGAYNVVAITPERGLRAFPDGIGLNPVYVGDHAGLTVVSNRSIAVGHLTGAEEWDAESFGWIVGHGSLIGRRVPAKGVEVVLPGTEIQADWGRSGSRIAQAATWFWPSDPDEGGRDNLSDDEWDAVTESLVDNVRAISEHAPLPMGITGGKDSRLVLSLALAAGVEVDAFTSGSVDSPEWEAASAVTAAAGIGHRRAGPPAEKAANAAKTAANPKPQPAPFDLDRAWTRLGRAVRRYEGIVTAWSAMNNPANPIPLVLKGFAGELYRRGNERQRPVDDLTLDQLATKLTQFQQRHDPLNVLRAAEIERQHEWIRAWVHEQAKTLPLQLIAEKLYVDYRLTHWTGALTQGTPNRVIVNPLVSRLAVQKNFELSIAGRSAERLHYEVMRRAAPGLVAVPFLKDTWSLAIRATAPMELPSEPFQVTVRPARTAGWGNPSWPLLEKGESRLEQLFTDAGEVAEFSKVFRVKRLRKEAKRAGSISRPGQARALMGAAGAAMAMLGQLEVGRGD